MWSKELWQERKNQKVDYITHKKIIENKLERKRTKIAKLKEQVANGRPFDEESKNNQDDPEIEFDIEGELDSRVDQIDGRIKEIESDFDLPDHQIVQLFSHFFSL